MTKNIPGSRRKRRGKRLRELISNRDITLKLGVFGEHGFEPFDEREGVLSYGPINGNMDRGYFFNRGQPDEMRIYIRKVSSIKKEGNIINYLIFSLT